MPTPKPNSKVVIVGAGPAGVHLAQLLHKAADVTLVDRKAYFEINWATVRAHVQPGLADAIFVPYQDIPHLGSVVQAEVASITSTHVELDTATTLQLDQSLRLPANGVGSNGADPSKLPYDYLAICTGSSYSNSTNKAGNASLLKDRKAGVQEGNTALQNAGSVLVIGAGPAGVETAAEIATAMAGKLVTLVSSEATVLPGTPPAMSKHVLHWLKKHGVKVLLNERVVKAADGTHATEKGTRLDADVVYTCTGAKPCTGFMKKRFAACLDEQSRIKVDSNLRIVGESPMNIFALGDCNNSAETKLGFLARAQAEVTAANIKILMRQPSGVTIAPKLEIYKPNNGRPKMLVVALGRKHGVMHVGGVIVEHLLPRIKSKGLFVALTRKQLGLKDRAGGLRCMRGPVTQE